MSRMPHRTFFRLAAMDARVGEAPSLNRSKILVGSDQRCDVVLGSRSISPQHCYLIVGEESVRVMDLASTNGIFVNGKRVREADVFPGDTLTIADLAFNLEAYESAEAFHDCEAEVAQLVTASHSAPIVIPDRAGLTLIDQEYCDLKLTENTQDLVTIPPFYLNGGVTGDELDSTVEPLDLVKDQADTRMEVVLYSSGHVVDIHFIDLNDGGLVLSGENKKNHLWFPGLKQDVRVVEHVKGRWNINVPEGFSLSGKEELGRDAVFLTCGVHQISLRMVEQTFKVNPLPFLWRDRAFFKEAGKVTAAVVLPFLLLLLISIPEMKVEEVKQLTIVYKAVQKTDGESKTEISATETTSKTENTGSKTTEQPKAETKMASSSAPAAAAQSAEAPAAAAPAKPKAFKFKSSVSLDAVVADAPADASATGRSPAATSKAIGASTSALGGSATGSGTSVGVGKLGSDASGSASTSAGAKGLVSKKGFDHSYLEPKTVVLGSMDPELLRKILQEYLPQFRHCYQQELMGASKDIKGVIDLDFQISPDGRVGRADIKAKDARFSKKGTNCMAQVLRIIEFPKPKGGGVVDVRQPLNFFAETEKI
ncbi:MAG: AgmX/PglI C-terminal domain-containing protein [Bacteriovoracaceae bacterium]|nr:AgmX/PglI C-terminal domain-containing protein [Bacteriovoracaceae bacterium]